MKTLKGSGAQGSAFWVGHIPPGRRPLAQKVRAVQLPARPLGEPFGCNHLISVQRCGLVPGAPLFRLQEIQETLGIRPVPRPPAAPQPASQHPQATPSASELQPWGGEDTGSFRFKVQLQCIHTEEVKLQDLSLTDPSKGGAQRAMGRAIVLPRSRWAGDGQQDSRHQ